MAANGMSPICRRCSLGGVSIDPVGDGQNTPGPKLEKRRRDISAISSQGAWWFKTHPVKKLPLDPAMRLKSVPITTDGSSVTNHVSRSTSNHDSPCLAASAAPPG